MRCILYLIAVAALGAVVGPRLAGMYRSWQQSSVGERLLAAVEAEDIETAAAALEAGADPNVTNDNGWTAMNFAVHQENAPLVKLLVDAGADHYAPVLLMVAVRSRHLPLARRLLEEGADPNVAPNGLPLHWSAHLGDVDMMELLLDFGADIEQVTTSQVRGGPGRAAPLRAAATSDQPNEVRLRAVEFLLRRGADPDSEVGGTTAMDDAVLRSDLALADLLRRHGAAYGAREAVALNRMHEVRQLIEENPELMATRCRPFGIAVYPGQEPTLLGLALYKGHDEMARYLIEQGAPLDTVEYYGQTPLHLAARYSSPPLIELLIERGSDVDARNDMQYTPLLECIHSAPLETIALLIDAGADVNARGHHDNTALLRAVQNDRLDVARLLAVAGADPTIPDSRGKTAAEVIQSRNEASWTEILDSSLKADAPKTASG